MYYKYQNLPTIWFYHVLIFALVKKGRFDTGTLSFALTRVMYIIVESSMYSQAFHNLKVNTTSFLSVTQILLQVLQIMFYFNYI